MLVDLLDSVFPEEFVLEFAGSFWIIEYFLNILWLLIFLDLFLGNYKFTFFNNINSFGWITLLVQIAILINIKRLEIQQKFAKESSC